MRHSIISFILISAIALPQSAFCAKLNQPDSSLTKPQKITSVAIVPYVEATSPEVNDLIKSVDQNLRLQKGIRVLEQSTTNEILDYYLKYVDASTRDNEGARLLREAREAYLHAEYDAASKSLKAAEAHIAGKEGGGETTGLMPDLLILKAKIAYVMGSKGAVAGIYEDLVRLDPELSFPEGLYSNWERKALAAAKEKLAPESTASIEITSDPINSEIYVNGIRKGVTYYDKPFVVNSLPPGRHCVEIKTIHYEPSTSCVTIAKDETKSIKATLKRLPPQKGTGAVTVSPQRYASAHELAGLVAGLGFYMGVNKVILVHKSDEGNPNALTYQIGDSSLGAVNKPRQLGFDPKAGSSLGLVTKEMRGEIKKDVLENPEDELISQSVGSMQLQEKRRKPLYKRPLFWVIAGAGAAATGGIAAVFLGAGAAVATTGGIIIGL